MATSWQAHTATATATPLPAPAQQKVHQKMSRTNCLTKTTHVPFGLVKVSPTIYGYVNWVWSCVTNTLTVMVKDISRRMLLNGVSRINLIFPTKGSPNLQGRCLKNIRLNLLLNLTETITVGRRRLFQNGRTVKHLNGLLRK